MFGCLRQSVLGVALDENVHHQLRSILTSMLTSGSDLNITIDLANALFYDPRQLTVSDRYQSAFSFYLLNVDLVCPQHKENLESVFVPDRSLHLNLRARGPVSSAFISAATLRTSRSTMARRCEKSRDQTLRERSTRGSITQPGDPFLSSWRLAPSQKTPLSS